MLIQIESDNTLRVCALLVYRGWFCKFSTRCFRSSSALYNFLWYWL